MISRKYKVDKKVRYGKMRIYLLIFCLLLALIFIILFKTNYFEINDVVVNNNHELSKDEVISYSGIQIGENIFKIKLSEIKEKLIKSPFIKDVTVKRKLPNILVLDLIERKKIAAILYMGMYFYIDNEGVILYTSNQIDDVYLIEGFEFKSFTEGEKIKVENEEYFKKVIDLCRFLEGSNLNIKPRVVYSDENINLYLNENFKVKLGKGENLSEKFTIFKAIYLDLINKNIDSGVVDISHDGYPTYSPFGQ